MDDQQDLNAPSLSDDAPINQPTASNETLESFGTQIAQQHGYDPNNPQTQAEINKVITLARNQMPGKSDADIINAIKEQGPAIAQKLTPQFQQLPGFDAGKYQALQSSFNQEFGDKAQLANREKLRNANVGLEVGRNLSMGSRLAAGPEYAGALNEQYTSGKKANEEAITGDWETRRKAKIAEMEQMVKNGEINAAQVKAETNNFALEQLRSEAADKQALNVAGNDPNSLVSQGARAMIEKGMPELVAKIPAEQWGKMTRQQIIQLIPSAEKRIEAQEKEGLEEVKRTSMEAEGKANRESKEKIAGMKTSGTETPLKPMEKIRVQSDLAKLDKDQREVKDKELSGNEVIKVFDKTGDLLNQGLKTGPLVGGEGTIGKAYTWSDPKMQQARQYISQMQSAMAKTFGGNPSNYEDKIMKDSVSILQLDDPVPALNDLRDRFQRALDLRKQEWQGINDRKAQLQSLLDQGKSAPANSNMPVPTSATQSNMQIPPAVQAGRDNERLAILQDELKNETDPSNKAALQREISRMSGSTPATTSSSIPSTNAKGWKLMTDASGNKAYVSPDKTQFEEVK